MTDPAAGPAGDSPTVPARVVWLCPLATAALLGLSYFPVAAGALAWFALVPLLVLVRLPGRPRRLYLACWVGALAFHWAVLAWVRVADPLMYFAWGLLATYGALYWPAALAVLRWIERRTPLPLVVTLPAVWVSLEYVRYGLAGRFYSILAGTHQHDVPGGFGWYLLGHTQHDFLEVIQISDVTGAFGVTALVAAVNALLFEALAGREWFRRRFLAGRPPRAGKVALLSQGVAVAGVLLLALGYGVWRMRGPAEADGPLLALMQTNTPQGRRNDATAPDEERRDVSRRAIANDFASLAEHARRQKPELIVTPETSYPGTWQEHYPGKPMKRCQELADKMAEHLRTAVLVGMSADVIEADGRERAYNSSILLGPDGRWLGRYDKIHRVPFGEYIPLKSHLPFLKSLAPYDYDYEVAPGGQFTRFPLATPRGDFTFGVMICYEDTDPAMARPYGGGGQAEADFLLNVSNDGWFRGSAEHDQHLAICRFRAVECRRAVARAVNMGISAIIDADGRVLAPRKVSEADGASVWEVPDGAGPLPVSRWHEFKKSAGIIVGRVPLDRRESFYARHGDWFAAACLAFVALCCAGLFVTGGAPPRQPAPPAGGEGGPTP